MSHTKSKKFPKSVYAATKSACEELVSVYAQQEKIKGSILRLCATVGPNLTHGVVKAFKEKLLSDNPVLEAFGEEPGPYKPYIHIDDVCGFIEALIEKDNQRYSVYNVCPQDFLSIKGVAETVMEKLDIHKPIKWLGKEYTWPGDNKVLYCESSLNWFGYETKYPTSKEAILNGV
jgi:UDP-glucose 4-epimerase